MSETCCACPSIDARRCALLRQPVLSDEDLLELGEADHRGTD